jgi:hypothetical protein
LSSERAFAPRYRLHATILAGVAAFLSLVGFVQASAEVSAPTLRIHEETSLFDLGWDWVPLTLAVFLLVFGAIRLTRRDPQARGFLIVGGMGVVLFALWEIFSIEDRAIEAAGSLVGETEAAGVRAILHDAVSRGILSISMNVGIYLVLAAGILALGAVALCFVSATSRPGAVIPASLPLPAPPAGSLGPEGRPAVPAPIHPVGERCLTCKAILDEETNVCWYCGRLWTPPP